MGSVRCYTPEDDEAIRQGWAKGLTSVEIGLQIDRPFDSINARAKRIGLPHRAHQARPRSRAKAKASKRSRDEFIAEVGKVAHSIRHRQALAIKLDSPIILRPTAAHFGFPIKDVDPETRALIDRAVVERRVAA